LVERTGDLVKGNIQKACLFQRQIYEHHRYCLVAQAACREQPLVAADDSVVFLAGDNRIYQPKLADAAREGLQFLVADAPRVGRVGF